MDINENGFALTKFTVPVVRQMAEVIPGGFFVYKEDEKRELLFANHQVLKIYGCKNLEEFKELTGYTFQGMVHPDDFDNIQEDIDRQVARKDNHHAMDHVIYRIIQKDGTVRWVDDYGHLSITEDFGAVFYVFINDITEARKALEEKDRIIAELQAKLH